MKHQTWTQKIARILVLLILLVGTNSALAENVIPIFDSQAFRIGLTLPFRIQSVRDNPLASINKVGIVSSDGSMNCVALPDPKIRENLLLKCDEPTEISLKIEIAEPGKNLTINYGPIQIKELKPGFREPKPIEPSAPNLDPEINQGRLLFFAGTGEQSCTSCHRTPTSKGNLMGSSQSQILDAFVEKDQMRSLTRLSPEQARKVSKYLQSVTDSEVWP